MIPTGRHPAPSGALDDGHDVTRRSVDRSPWRLDPMVAYLNHGSFGACPSPVLDVQAAWRERMEAEPVDFLARDLEAHLDGARTRLGSFLDADPDGLAFVHNATSGVATVLASLRFKSGDELLATDHEYNATLNALSRVAARDGARVVTVRLPFPTAGPGEVVTRILGAVTPRTRLALLSHVTSPTALVMPMDDLVPELEGRGVAVLVDGAHAPGMIPLHLDGLGASYYTGNGHKWLCAPKGAAFLWVRADRRTGIHPLVTSHGANDPRHDRSTFRLEADWLGTDDPTAWLSIPAAIDAVGALDPGGWPAIMAANRALALEARDRLATALAVGNPAPDSMIGAMAAVPLPSIERAGDPDDRATALGDALRARGFEVPVFGWPVRAARPSTSVAVGGIPERVLLRVSAQRYVGIEEIDDLVLALAELGVVG
jgi:isopenicillin-N epimerase